VIFVVQNFGFWLLVTGFPPQAVYFISFVPFVFFVVSKYFGLWFLVSSL